MTKESNSNKGTTISSADELVRTTKNGQVELTEEELKRVSGGKPQKADGSLDAGIHFKYDLKAQKEA
jgi:bacteriocin-like protein